MNVVFGVLVGASFAYMSFEFAFINSEFYDQGVLLIAGAFALAYFVVWALLYYSKLRAYSHYSAQLVPLEMLVLQMLF